jgi:1-acyl-sn-glycerol-3-phosphate acyltransferase
MKSKQQTFFLTRCWRMVNLICWLVHTLWRVRFLKNKTLAERNKELISISEDFLQVINVHIKLNNTPSDKALMPWLTVANHVSMIDMFVLMKYIPGGFIATKNIRKWPILGNLITNVGTVYINRHSRQDITPVSQAIEKALRLDKNVLFFPEAYTSSGLDTLPFKAALFQAAIDAHVPVQAVALRYYDGSDRSDKVSFAGSISVLRSIWQITSIPEILVKVDFAPLLNIGDDCEADRYELKKQAEQFIRDKVLSDSPLKEQTQITAKQ